MFAIKPGLAALALLPVPFVVLSAMRYNRRSRPAVQEIQQRLAELTAEVEEGISGIRIVKAFARERLHARALPPLGRAGLRPERLLDPPAGLLLAAARLPAEPRAGGGAPGRRAAGDQRHPLARRLHRLLHLPDHAHRRRCGCSAWRSGWRSGRSPRATGCSRSSIASRGSRARRTRRRCPRARAGSSCAASRSPTTAARPRWRTSTSRSRPGGRWRSSGPPARARRAWWRCWRGCMTRAGARC